MFTYPVGFYGGGGKGWDVSNASYDSVSFSVTTQENLPFAMFFKPDGAILYVVGITNDRVYQYTVGTPWDISTASYSGKSALVGSQSPVTTSLSFSVDGTKMYIMGNNNNTIYQYTLSTPWDVSTSSYASKLFSTATQEGNSRGIFMSKDGLLMFMVGSSNNRVHQYTLGTAWDISTSSYTGKFLSISTEETNPYDLFINPDGDTLFIIGDATDSVYQYDLPNSWDLTAASYSGVSFSVTSEDAKPYDLSFKEDGTKMYMLGNTNDTVYQYSL